MILFFLGHFFFGVSDSHSLTARVVSSGVIGRGARMWNVILFRSSRTVFRVNGPIQHPSQQQRIDQSQLVVMTGFTKARATGIEPATTGSTVRWPSFEAQLRLN